MNNRFCPSCDAALGDDDINVKEGVALCPACGRLARLAELVDYAERRATLSARPPDGCTADRFGREVRVVCSLRSFSGALVSLGICLFWNGIVSVFVCTAAAGLYQLLVGPLPEWFPAPEMEGQLDSIGEVAFLCLFLTPFVVIGASMFGAVFLNLFGKTVAEISGRTAMVRTNIGPFGWTRRFDPQAVRSVSQRTSRWQSEDSSRRLIEIAADTTLRFGAFLRDDRQAWMTAVLEQLLLGDADAADELLDRIAR